MMYLSDFTFPSEECESYFLQDIKETCYTTYYPFRILSRRGCEELVFEPITILYGGNGSGKTTALNVIAEKLGLRRETLYNRSNFFEDYTERCDYDLVHKLPPRSCIITSDDVFDYLLSVRSINSGIDDRRDELMYEFGNAKYFSADFRFRSMDDYEMLDKIVYAQTKGHSSSSYVRKNLMNNLREHSNGENAFIYFTEKIRDAGLYLLDEPENSLSPDKQIELAQFLQDSARFFGCQFIIATHSPLLLAMEHAAIYDMDEDPVCRKKWTELENVRKYYEFFQKHADEF